MTAIFTLAEVGKVFVSQTGAVVPALRDVNLTVHEGEFLCLVGRSGCGKTTLLRILAGLEPPTVGAVLYRDSPITGCDPRRGMVFQDTRLFLWRNVGANIEFGLEVRGLPKAQRRRIVARYAELMGLSDFVNVFTYELSGGMQQRVALARVLATDPHVILMDEPFAALDALTRQTLQEELLRLVEVERKTVVFVTHSVDEAVFLADRIAVFTPRPGTIGKIVSIDLTKPRKRESPETTILRRDIYGLIAEYDD